MATRILDEVNLQKIGINQRNIAALRNISTIVVGAVLETSEIEKLVLTAKETTEDKNTELLEKRLLLDADRFGALDNIENRVNQLERRLLLQEEFVKIDENTDINKLFYSLFERIETLERFLLGEESIKKLIYQLLERIETLESA